MLTDDLKQLLADTPGVLVAGEAATDLVEDIQAVVIRHLLASSNRAALEKVDAESLQIAIEDTYHSPLGVALFNLYTLADFPDKRHVLPSARKDVVLAMIRAMLLEQIRHIEVKPFSEAPTSLASLLIRMAADDYAAKGC